MADESDLRRRAQPLLDRPPYERRPLEKVRERAAQRKQRARRRLGAWLCVVVVAVGTVGAVARYHGRPDDPIVAVRTTGTAPPVTVPAGTTIADLRFTPIAGPDGDNWVEMYAAGDGFLAVEGDQGLSRAWTGDAEGHWRRIKLPDRLRGTRLGSVVQLRRRVVVVGTTNRGTVVLEGASLDRLELSHWKSENASLPAAIHPAPPPGRGIEVTAAVETAAVGEIGIVMAGRVFAGLNRDLLPQSVREALAQRPGRIDVRDGRVIVTLGGLDNAIFDRPATSLGLTAREVEYLSRSDDSHSEIAVWGAAWGKPIRQLSGAGIDTAQRLGNVALTRASGGFVLAAPTAASSEMWWSSDGRSWQHLASPPRAVLADDSWLIELGSRWVVPSADGISDDGGRSWTPIDLSGDLANTRGTGSLLGSRGSSAFGLLAASTPIDPATVTTFAGRLLYSPDGVHWSSVALDKILEFKANIPAIAVGDRSAILQSGLRAPGAQLQRFWLITRPG